MLDNATIQKIISQKFKQAEFEEFKGLLGIRIPKEIIIDLLEFLKSSKELSFDYLTDLTAVDFLAMEKEPRFQVVYHLYSFKYNLRLKVKAMVPEEDVSIDTASVLWKGALWLEREVFDLFGINFKGHTDLRRILLPDTFDGHPLRKDYPVRGRGERDVILDLK